MIRTIFLISPIFLITVLAIKHDGSMVPRAPAIRVDHSTPLRKHRQEGRFHFVGGKMHSSEAKIAGPKNVNARQLIRNRKIPKVPVVRPPPHVQLPQQPPAEKPIILSSSDGEQLIPMATPRRIEIPKRMSPHERLQKLAMQMLHHRQNGVKNQEIMTKLSSLSDLMNTIIHKAKKYDKMKTEIMMLDEQKNNIEHQMSGSVKLSPDSGNSEKKEDPVKDQQTPISMTDDFLISKPEIAISPQISSSAVSKHVITEETTNVNKIPRIVFDQKISSSKQTSEAESTTTSTTRTTIDDVERRSEKESDVRQTNMTRTSLNVGDVVVLNATAPDSDYDSGLSDVGAQKILKKTEKNHDTSPASTTHSGSVEKVSPTENINCNNSQMKSLLTEAMILDDAIGSKEAIQMLLSDDKHGFLSSEVSVVCSEENLILQQKVQAFCKSSLGKATCMIFKL